MTSTAYQLCTCGHVGRIHGSRPGFTLPDNRCRACDCPAFIALEADR